MAKPNTAESWMGPRSEISVLNSPALCWRATWIMPIPSMDTAHCAFHSLSLPDVSLNSHSVSGERSERLLYPFYGCAHRGLGGLSWSHREVALSSHSWALWPSRPVLSVRPRTPSPCGFRFSFLTWDIGERLCVVNGGEEIPCCASYRSGVPPTGFIASSVESGLCCCLFREVVFKTLWLWAMIPLHQHALILMRP